MKATTAVRKLTGLANRLERSGAWKDAEELRAIADLLRHRAAEEEDQRSLENRRGYAYNK